MSSSFNKIAKDFANTLRNTNTKKPTPYDTQAEVRRVDGDTAWVHIPGGVDETPVQLTTSAKKGDIVQVRVSGGRAWLYGNATNPPTDDTKANEADIHAGEAMFTAIDALESSEIARQAADKATEYAQEAENQAAEATQSASEASRDAQAAANAASNAQTSADAASQQAQAATESASTAGIAASRAQAAAEAAQGDIDEQENWFWHDSLGAHILGQTSGFRTDLTSTGMDVTAIALEKVVAHFGADNVVLGSLTEAIRAVITNTRFAFQTDSGDIAYFGLNSEGIWQMHIATTFVDDMIRFGDYAWIKRDNGNMSIKWLGGVE